MRIESWGIGRIIELPDFCFGRRFVVSCSVVGGDGTEAWDISELAFGEKMVVWEVRVFSSSAGVDIDSIRLALGDQVPVSAAMMDRLEPLVPGLGAQGADPRAINPGVDGGLAFTQLRVPVATSGRRLVLEVTGAAGKTPRVTVGIVVSSVPREIPEWLSLDRVS